ncbi:P-II family nitrogen regulator [Pseudomonadota bacterium]
MANLYPHKLVNIITMDVLQEKLREMFRRHGVSGYTIIRVRGEGGSGASEGVMDFEASVMIKVIVPEEKLQRLLDGLQRQIDKGYRLTIFVNDVDVISPEKFQSSLK